jgi:hypothetical protein
VKESPLILPLAVANGIALSRAMIRAARPRKSP